MEVSSLLLLKTELKKRFNGKIILTRDKDVYIPLDERTAIANMKQADLFVSIHVNASPNRKARGVETYFLDYANDKNLSFASSKLPHSFVSRAEMAEMIYWINYVV